MWCCWEHLNMMALVCFGTYLSLFCYAKEEKAIPTKAAVSLVAWYINCFLPLTCLLTFISFYESVRDIQNTAFVLLPLTASSVAMLFGLDRHDPSGSHTISPTTSFTTGSPIPLMIRHAHPAPLLQLTETLQLMFQCHM